MREESLAKIMAAISIGFFTAAVALAAVGKYVASISSLVAGLALLSFASSLAKKGAGHEE